MRELGSGDIFYIIGAVRWTLLLSVIAFIGGSIGGALVALARTGEFRWLRMLAAGIRMPVRLRGIRAPVCRVPVCRVLVCVVRAELGGEPVGGVVALAVIRHG